MDDGQGGEELVAAFTRWAGTERAGLAAASRTRERWLREQLAASATWIGTLVDLSEKRDEVKLAVGASRFAGRVVGVGRDFCVLDQAGSRPVLVRARSIEAAWPGESSWRSVAGEGSAPIEMSMNAAVATLADERTPVSLLLDGGAVVEGELIGAGEDVLIVRLRGAARRQVYVQFDAISACELR